MTTLARPRGSRAGFSLIELVITMTILAILVGVVSFRSGAVVERSKTTKIISLIDTLKTACAMHHADTGSFAYEYTGQAQARRKLSGNQTTAGWGGPYIDGPLAHGNHNPYGNVHLYSSVTANNWLSGFDIDGDGTDDITGDGNMLVCWSIPEDAGQQVNDSLDQGQPGDWRNTGRVRYDAGTQRLYVLVYY